MGEAHLSQALWEARGQVPTGPGAVRQHNGSGNGAAVLPAAEGRCGAAGALPAAAGEVRVERGAQLLGEPRRGGGEAGGLQQGCTCRSPAVRCSCACAGSCIPPGLE